MLETNPHSDDTSNERSTLLEKGVQLAKQSHDDHESTRKSSDSEAQLSISSAARVAPNLPPEIMAEIFMNCLPSTRFVQPQQDHAPMLLTRINASWRSICLSTPRLWSSLEIHWGPVFMGEAGAALMEMWLSRAGVCPLSLSILGDSLVETAVMNTLSRLSAQWQHVRIRATYNQPPPFHPGIETPLLETFELITPSGLDSMYIQQLSSTLKSAPLLRQFAWDNAGIPHRSLDIDWSQLTHLTLNTELCMEDCLNILGQSQKMTHIAFQSVTMQSPNTHRTPILLPSLYSFGISTDQDITPLLDTLVLPGLRELVSNTRITSVWPWPQASFLSFLDRSRCALESLAFYFADFSVPEFIDCIQRTQDSLRALTVQMDDGIAIMTDEVIGLLTHREDGNACLCPKLEVLALYECVSCSEGRLADMIQSRLKTPTVPPDDPSYVARIKVVEAYDSEKELGPLKELRDQGLVLKTYSLKTGEPNEMEPDDVARLQKMYQDGLALQIYAAATGQFWETSD